MIFAREIDANKKILLAIHKCVHFVLILKVCLYGLNDSLKAFFWVKVHLYLSLSLSLLDLVLYQHHKFCCLENEVKICYEEVGFQFMNATNKFGLILCT